MTTREIIRTTRNAKNALLTISSEEKNKALLSMADAVLENEASILQANEKDMVTARGRITDSMLDRLLLTPARLESMAEGIRAVAAL